MPATAPNTGSVSQRKPSVKTSPVLPIERTQRRFATRMEVICDASICPAARLLYVLLDDYAGGKGIAWPRQTTLAQRLGCSEVSIRSQLRELEDAGYLERRKGQSGVKYLLSWAAPTESQVSVPNAVPTESQLAPTESQVSVPTIKEPVLREPGPCIRCADTGWILYTSHSREGKTTAPKLCGCKSLAEAGGWGGGDRFARMAAARAVVRPLRE